MSNNTVPEVPIRYRDLNAFERGFADCLVEFESEGVLEDEWKGIGVHDLSGESLTKMVADCRRFMQAVVGDAQHLLDELAPKVCDYDLGRSLYLERQRTGLGFADLLAKSDVRDRMVQVADEMGELTVEISDDGKICISRHREIPSSPST